MKNAGAQAPASENGRVFSAGFRHELDALFQWRRDVRRFLTDPVPDDLTRAVLAAAASAPSVGLSEPWRFIRVESVAARADVIANFERCNADALAGQPDDRQPLYASLKLSGLRDAPVHLAVFCDEDGEQGHGLGALTMPEMRRYSVVCAVMQMWLAARAMGLGMGWVSILDPAHLSRDLDAPDSWSLIAYLCIGWPEEEHTDCELERAGWEDRLRLAGRILTR